MDNTLERKEAFIKAKKDMDAIIKGLNADEEIYYGTDNN